MQAKQLMNRKTVCHISYHPPLDDRIYWKELIALQEAGYKVVHLCVSDRDADYITNEGIRIIEMKRQRIVPYLWLNRAIQIVFKNKGILKILLQKAADIKAHIYHYHDLQINAIAPELKQLPQNPKVIYDVHEVYWQVAKEQYRGGIVSKLKAHIISSFYKKWELKKAAYCDYIIATDEYTLHYFQKKLPHLPAAIVYNYSYYLPDQIPAYVHQPYHFIYTGLLSKTRGILDALAALSLLVKEQPEARLLLIGPYDHPHFEIELQEKIAERQLQNNVCLHQPVPFLQIASFYQKAKVGLGLFHATPKYTTFIPIKLFEYMAFGLPVIFCDHGPSAKIIKQSNCGILVVPQNIHAIYEAMKRLLNDKELYGIYSQNAQAAIHQTYNWNTEKEKLLAIYAAM